MPRNLTIASDDDSIDSGKISVLALLEIPLSIIIFWGISKVSSWPWMTLVGLMAVPLLLFRSQASIAKGVFLFEEFWGCNKNTTNQKQSASLLAIVFVMTLLLFYLTINIWFVNNSGVKLFFRSMLLGIITFVVAISGGYAGAIISSGLILFTDPTTTRSKFKINGYFVSIVARNGQLISYIIALAAMLSTLISQTSLGSPNGIIARTSGITLIGTYTGTCVCLYAYGLGLTVQSSMARPGAFFSAGVIYLGMVISALVGFIDFPILNFTTTNFIICGLLIYSVVDTAIAATFVMPAFITGIIIRAIFIRFLSTLQYLHLGLTEFSNNWRETVCVVNMLYSPKLLPGAEHVDNVFSFDSLMGAKIGGSIGGFILALSTKIFLGLCIYLPTLLYRFNIKASAFIWGPIALILHPEIWVKDEIIRSRTAFWSTWPFLSFYLSLTASLLLWLFSPLLSNEWISKNNQLLIAILNYGVIPGIKIFSFFIILLAASLLFLLKSAYTIRSAHAKAMEGAGDYHKGYDDELKEEFRQLARPVRHWLKWNTAISIITIWIFSLWWALQHWPHKFQNIVWNWIQPYLL